jgi:mannose-1-phosphate guanylyltransferase/mannose-6-phosphate isomerase
MNTELEELNVLPVILCGGAGSRLWPLSRKSAPKQFHELASSKTMFCDTLDRVSSKASDIYAPARIIGAAEFEGVIVEQSKASTIKVEKYIYEPCMRDTCAAIAAAISDIALSNPEQIVLVLPSDHHVADLDGFSLTIKRAGEAVKLDGGIMTIGIKPNHPETQFGYIERAQGSGPIYDVERFREKPDLAAAKAYLDLGTFFWNAGIFMFKAGDMASEFERQQPEIFKFASLAMSNGQQTDNHHYLDKEHFTSCEKVSIDYGIMEHAANIRTIQAAFDWSDLGSWSQLHEASPQDVKGNAIIGDVVTTGVRNSYIRAEDRPVAIAGLDDIVVVSQSDALMVVARDKSYMVKDLHNMISQTPWPPKVLNTSGIQIPYKDKVKDWIFNLALPYWAKNSIDYEFGGVHEALDYAGKPVDLGKKRLRVLARQIYCYAEAQMLGWDGNYEEVLDHCVKTLIETGWHKDGGFIHLYNLDGTVQDDTRDAYDQCFVLLGFAALWKAQKNPLAKEWGEKTLQFMDRQFADEQNGGYFETPGGSDIRRANPHMHFFEAMLAWYEATGEEQYLDRAKKIIDLFKTKFFDHENWRLHEMFDANWVPLDNDINKVEPGHHYEWVWLLLKYVTLSGDNSVKDYARKLYATALAFGHYTNTDSVALTMHFDGSELSPTGRMWCQTEGLKAALALKEHGMTVDGNLASRMLDQIYNRYLDTPQPGGWYDATDSEGRIVSTDMPTSTFYHVLCAFSEYLRVENLK